MRSEQSIQKQATADASEYAAAYMSIGEGAGNRRKLIEGTVDYKMEFVPGYREAFTEAHSTQNMAKHAEKARKDNRRKQVSKSIDRNGRALLNGDPKHTDLKLLVLIGAAAAAHKTGMDKKAWEFGKRKIADVKKKYGKDSKTHVAEPNADGVYTVTDI